MSLAGSVGLLVIGLTLPVQAAVMSPGSAVESRAEGATDGDADIEQRSEDASTADLAKQLRNPLSNLREVFFQLDVLPKSRSAKGTVWRGSVQPVWPIDLSHGWKMVTYGILPILSVPGPTDNASRVGGLGDTQLFGYVVPPNERGLLWGVGPSLGMPTHTNSALGQNAWSAGPALIVGGQPGNWSIFFLFSNVWDFAGSDAVNLFDLQYDVSYLLPADWFLMSNWIVEADWTATPEDRWTVPVGAGFGRQFKVGSQQMQAYGQVGYNVIRPREASTFRAAITLSLVF